VAKSFYDVLGVKRDASDKDIRKAYRQLARKLHPDVNPGDAAAEKRFKEVNSAYEVLKDPEKRKKYDRWGENWEHAEQFEAAQRAGAGRWYGANTNAYQVNLDDLEDLGGLGDILGSMFGRGSRRARAPRPAQLEQPIEVTLEEAFQGTARTIQLSLPRSCPTCGGSGEIAGAICHTCQGQGVVIEPERIEVKIPAGVKTGSRVRVAGKGGPSNGRSASDLILVITVRPHERFERRGDDLYTTVQVPLADALLGGEAAVPTLKGTSVMLRIPELTQNERSFRLRGLGMPHLNREGSGDLYARVSIRLPESLSTDQKKAIETLRSGHATEGARR
jgi:molecular chaperone DnaJ